MSDESAQGRHRRRGTWGLFGGLGSALGMGSTGVHLPEPEVWAAAGSTLERLALGLQGAFPIVMAVLGVVIFAIEKRGDINRDGKVDLADLRAFASAAQSAATNPDTPPEALDVDEDEWAELRAHHDEGGD